MNKKKILSLALVVLLLATISFGTLAWFNDKDEITNTFHVATSEDPADPDDIFSVDVWEYVNGNVTDKDQDGAAFENILPGSRVHKEVYVENTGAYAQYVRVNVSISEAKAFQDALGDYDLSESFQNHNETIWTRYDDPVYDKEADTLTYTYYLNRKLSVGDKACLFTHVVIPTALTQQDIAAMGGNFALTVVAEAVQADNLDATTAAEAFAEIGWKVGTDYGA